MTYNVPFLRHMTSNKTYDFGMFSKFVNFELIDLKIRTHIDWTLQKCIDQNNVSHVSMATKYPIIKHRAFFKTCTFFISTNNEDIGQKFLADTYDHTLKDDSAKYLWSCIYFFFITH